MINILNSIGRELNPVHDLDRFDDLVNNYPNNTQSLSRAVRQLPAFGKNTLKHLVRGAFIGGLAGGLYSCLTNSNPGEAIEIGAVGGSTIDSLQYLIRGYLTFTH